MPDPITHVNAYLWIQYVPDQVINKQMREKSVQTALCITCSLSFSIKMCLMMLIIEGY